MSADDAARLRRARRAGARRPVRCSACWPTGRTTCRQLIAPARAEPDWPAALDEIARVRAATLAHLDRYVDEFATNVERAGGHVFFAADAAEARRHVAGLARERGVKLVVKSKSMVTEEIGLNPALEAEGVEVVETDLGEFIVQMAHERPFHILEPAIHMSLERVRRLFSADAGRDLGGDAHALTGYARGVLREKFFAADMGITGCNFGVAATGSVVLVTNEGNGRMTTTLPRTHVVVMGVERLVPTFPDLEAILKVLPRAGVGLRATAYVTAITGPRRPGEARRPRGAPCRDRRQRALAHPRRQVPRDPRLHPLRGVPRHLPGVPQDRRPRLRLGVQRADRRGAQPAARRARVSPGTAVREQPLRRLHRGVFGADPAGGHACASCARTTSRRWKPRRSWRLGFRAFDAAARRPRLWAAAEDAGAAARPPGLRGRGPGARAGHAGRVDAQPGSAAPGTRELPRALAALGRAMSALSPAAA